LLTKFLTAILSHGVCNTAYSCAWDGCSRKGIRR